MRQMTLSAEEFIRRFLLHVLPKRFVRIRHYGLLAARNVDTRLARCRALLDSAAEPSPVPSPSALDLPGGQQDWATCPHCRGPLRRRELPVGHAMLRLASASILSRPVEVLDSS